MFFTLILGVQFFTIPTIFESTSKIFEIVQNTYTGTDPSQLLTKGPEILQIDGIQKHYSTILTYTGINLISSLILFLIFQGLIWFLLHKTIHKVHVDINLFLIPAIYFFICLLLIFTLTPYIYQNEFLTINIMIGAIVIFTYLSSFFYAALCIKKTFLEMLLSPIKTPVLVLPFVSLILITLLLTLLLIGIFKMSEILGIAYFATIYLTSFQLSRIFLIYTMKKFQKD